MNLSNEILGYLREKIEIKVKTRRASDGSYIDVRVELWLDSKLISYDEDSVNIT